MTMKKQVLLYFMITILLLLMETIFGICIYKMAGEILNIFPVNNIWVYLSMLFMMMMILAWVAIVLMLPGIYFMVLRDVTKRGEKENEY